MKKQPLISSITHEDNVLKNSCCSEEYVEKKNTNISIRHQKIVRKRRKLVRKTSSITQKQDPFFTEDKIEGLPYEILNENITCETLNEHSDWEPAEHKRFRKKGYTTKKHKKHDRQAGYSTKKHKKHKKHKKTYKT